MFMSLKALVRRLLRFVRVIRLTAKLIEKFYKTKIANRVC